jgi:hypothetical protein
MVQSFLAQMDYGVLCQQDFGPQRAKFIYCFLQFTNSEQVMSS